MSLHEDFERAYKDLERLENNWNCSDCSSLADHLSDVVELLMILTGSGGNHNTQAAQTCIPLDKENNQSWCRTHESPWNICMQKQDRTEFPELFEAVEKQRGRRQFHWSGQSRTALSRKFFGTGKVYQALSWEPHSVMTGIRDFTVRKGGGLKFAPHADQQAAAEAVAHRTGGMLYNIWNEYAETFTLRQVKLPDHYS